MLALILSAIIQTYTYPTADGLLTCTYTTLTIDPNANQPDMAAYLHTDCDDTVNAAHTTSTSLQGWQR